MAADEWAEGWSPAPLPLQRSPFYSLKSIAFDRAVGSTKLAPNSARGSSKLPPLAAASSPRGVAADQHEFVLPAAGEETAQQRQLRALRARRDSALAEHTRLHELLATTARRFEREARLRMEAEQKIPELRARLEAAQVGVQAEQDRVQEQHEILRRLRARERELQGEPIVEKKAAGTSQGHPAFVTGLKPRVASTEPHPPSQQQLQSAGPQAAQATPPAAKAAPREAALGEAGSPPRPSPAGGSSSPPPRDAGPVPETPPADVASTLECLLEEMKELKKVFTERAPDTSEEASPGAAAPPPLGASTASLDSEEAEIDIVRRHGLPPYACLRHPSGSEACIDLATSTLNAWRRPDGLEAPAGTVSFLWPRALDGVSLAASSSAECFPCRPWRLTLMDDSNNEPSITLSCGGDGGAGLWHLRRTLTLGADSLKEQFVVESLVSKSEVDARPALRLEMREQASVPTGEDQTEGGDEVQGEIVTLSPGECWGKSRVWTTRSVGASRS